LEPNREVVDEDEERSAEAQDEPACASDGTVLQKAWRNGGVILLPDLNANKSDQEHTEDDEKGDDLSVRPRVFAATPLQSKEQADNHRQEDKGAEDVELLRLFLPGRS
jgi:hypothetical protein